jgi:hypothetical protein
LVDVDLIGDVAHLVTSGISVTSPLTIFETVPPALIISRS